MEIRESQELVEILVMLGVMVTLGPRANPVPMDQTARTAMMALTGSLVNLDRRETKDLKGLRDPQDLQERMVQMVCPELQVQKDLPESTALKDQKVKKVLKVTKVKKE